MQDLTIDTGDYRGLTCVVPSGCNNTKFENVTMTGRGSACYKATPSGSLEFNKCTISTCGYGIDLYDDGSGPNGTKDLTITDCTVSGWNSFEQIDNATITNTAFTAANDEGKYGILATLRPSCNTTITNSTFCDEYTTGSTNTYVGLGAGSAINVNLNNCRLASKDDGTGLTEIVNYASAFKDDESANGAKFSFNALYDDDGHYMAATIVSKLLTSHIYCSSGASCAILRASSGSTPQSGYGAIYIVGKAPETTEIAGKIYLISGCFASDPSEYVTTGYTIVTNYDNGKVDSVYPFKVKVREDSDPEQPTVVRETDNTITVASSITDEATRIQAAAAASNTSVEEIYNYVNINNESTRTAILSAATQVEGTTIDATKIAEASLVELEFSTRITVEEIDNNSTGAISYNLKPIAVVKTHKNGTLTGVASNVEIDNAYLNGEEITIDVCSALVYPKQVAHISDDASIELFTKGDEASYEDKTYTYNPSSQNVSMQITHFSTIKVVGTNTYTTVKYDANGGSGIMASQIVEFNSTTATVASCSFTYSGYKFTE